MKNIIFIDFNGVISYQPFWNSIQSPDHELHYLSEHIERFLFKENINIVNDWMMGKQTSEEIHNLLRARLPVDFSKDALFRVFKNDCINIDVYDRILNAIMSLRDKSYLVLMTDNMDCFDRFTVPSNPRLREVFDYIVNSSSTGRGKRSLNCKSFIDVIDKFSTSHPHSILIDDSNGNCTAFEQFVGGKSFRTKNENEVLEALGEIVN